MSFSVRICAALVLALGTVPGTAQIAASPVVAPGGMVVSGEPFATRAGVEILAAGGNAVDAAVAVGFALAVTLPSAGNLGGGGFMVIHTAAGQEVAVDFREVAPRGASRDMYLGEDGKPVSARSRRGHLACGVPGTVAGLCHIQEKYGTLPLKAVLAPAMKLAREGFPVSRFLAASLRTSARYLGAHAESRRVFLNSGKRWVEGDQFTQPDLLATLDRIASRGRDGFYGGKTAELIVAEMRAGGGLITAEDLAAYPVKERTPVKTSYRGYQIVSMPTPSSGGVALVQMLNVLEGYPLARLGPGSEQTLHYLAESMRWAFRDRALYMGDPDFTPLPLKRLLSRSHGEKIRAHIGVTAAVSQKIPGLVSPPAEKEQTTHYSVMDRKGNAVACTYTLNGGYGSGVTVTGAGFLLNNEMDDFASAPGTPNMFGLLQGEANAVGPGKRPLSSMTPTLVLRDSTVLMVIGSPGGPTIINTVLQCIINVIDHGMNISQAVAAPRIHHQWMPDRIDHEPYGIGPDPARGLRARGHLLRRRSVMGDAHGITYDPKRRLFHGAADPRHGGLAEGWHTTTR